MRKKKDSTNVAMLAIQATMPGGAAAPGAKFGEPRTVIVVVELALEKRSPPARGADEVAPPPSPPTRGPNPSPKASLTLSSGRRVVVAGLMDRDEVGGYPPQNVCRAEMAE